METILSGSQQAFLLNGSCDYYLFFVLGQWPNRQRKDGLALIGIVSDKHQGLRLLVDNRVECVYNLGK